MQRAILVAACHSCGMSPTSAGYSLLHRTFSLSSRGGGGSSSSFSQMYNGKGFGLAVVPTSWSPLQCQQRFKAKAMSKGYYRKVHMIKGKRLGLKCVQGTFVNSGYVLAKQKWEQWAAGENTYYGEDWTVYSAIPGVVIFSKLSTELWGKPQLNVSPYWKEYYEEMQRREQLRFLGKLPRSQYGALTWDELEQLAADKGKHVDTRTLRPILPY